MEDNPQEALKLTISSRNNTLEFIKHRDLHYYVYVNGMMTDVRIPRHIADEVVRDFDNDGNYSELYASFMFGKSNYNKGNVLNILVDICPECFI